MDEVTPWNVIVRAAAVFAVMVLWIRVSKAGSSSVQKTSYAVVFFGTGLAVMGGVVIMTPNIPVAAGLSAMGMFGVLSHAACLVLAPESQSQESSVKTEAAPQKAHIFIADGRVLPAALQSIGKDIAWVDNLLRSYGISSADRVALAEIDEQERVLLARKDDGPKRLH